MPSVGVRALLLCSVFWANTTAPDAALAPRHQAFLDETALLAGEAERAAFLALRRDYQRDEFIERFWGARDPFPETARNEFRDRWSERLALAQTRYDDPADERRRVLLLLGEPHAVRRPLCATLLRPLEIWYYDSSEWLRGDFYLVFVSPQGSARARHRLWQPGMSLQELVDFTVGAAATPAEIAQRIAEECASGDDLLAALSSTVDWRRLEQALQPILRPGDEWLRAFQARSTEAPADAPALAADLRLRFPGRHQSRTVVQAILGVAAGGPDAAQPAARGGYNLLIDGEVVLKDELFESFRYRFDLPDISALPAAGAEPMPLVVERYLRPGSYSLVLKVQDLNSGRVYRVERALEVPFVEHAPAAADPAAAAAPAAAPTAVTALAGLDETGTAAGPDDDAHGLELFAPADELHTGRVRVEAVASGEGVARVVFSLNGRPVLSKARPPYAVELDVGRAPRLHRLHAAAVDTAGRELASDEVLLNAGPHRFRVRLLQPQRGRRYLAALRAEAEVEVPEGERLERIEIYLNETRVATLYQPPFVQPIVLPAGSALAFVRAVGYLADGNSAEDVVFVNGPELVEEVRVDLVELYTTVVDRRGHPVEGLERADFSVLEDGHEQEVARFEPVRDLPIHAGVLLDTSASMTEELEDAVRAALRFFQQVITPKDRAAFLTFNERPSLVVPFTNNPEVLAGGLAALTAEGETALYDSLVYALHYFSGLKGKRAVVLLSDGQDVMSRYRFEDALDFARRTGVAIYAIGLDLPQREFEARAKLQRLAEETGGHSFFIADTGGLERVYERIQQELRSQYLLAYQSPQQEDGERFRAVEVKLRRPGLEAKTIRGYYP